MKSTCPGNGKSLIIFSSSDAANSMASPVEMHSSASPHFSITALQCNPKAVKQYAERTGKELKLQSTIYLRITLQLLIKTNDAG